MDRRKRGFLKILRRYIDGSSDKEEKEAMDLWYNALDKEHWEDLNFASRQEKENKIWKLIQDKKQAKNSLPATAGKKWWDYTALKLASAASVLLVLGFIYFISDYRKIKNFPIANISQEKLALLSKITNAGSQKQIVTLADGSRITLEPHATLYYPKIFSGSKRIVYLDGNGYFDITKNPDKPFLVYTGTIVTKVLGTSFTIHKSAESGNIEVAVMTGKVIVEKAENNDTGFDTNTAGVVLTPNKKVTFLHDSEKYVTGLVEKPVLVEKSNEFLKPGAFTFEEVPLMSVIEKLEKAYGVEIKLVNEAIANCPITADLPNESLFVKLEIISALLNTKSEIKGTTILLTGGECVPFNASQP